MKPLLLLLLIPIFSCNHSIKSRDKSSIEYLKDSLEYLQTVYQIKVDSIHRMIYYAIQKADGDTLLPSAIEELNRADSSDINCIIQQRLLVKEKQRLQRELRFKIAGGTSRGTILRYKIEIAKAEKGISDNMVKHYWLYKEEYWNDFLHNLMEKY